jgi:cysteine desulfurase/selenocysteine lyase
MTRVPTAPTLPDPEPAALTLLVQRMANELFASPPAIEAPESPEPLAAAAPGSAPPAPSGPSASAASPHAPTSPPSPQPIGGAPSASAPAAPGAHAAHPFLAEPRFDGLLGHGTPHASLDHTPDAFRIPFVDEVPGATDAPRDPGLPAFGELPAKPNPALARNANHQGTAYTPAYEVEPLLTLELPQESRGFDANALRKEFPILEERVHGKRLVWLDNAATTQKPKTVIDRLSQFYAHENSNIHRAAHALAARATDAYEAARESVRRFVNAPSTENVVFVRGTTEAINLVAQSWGRKNVGAGDEIIVSHLEHHANIVPWQLLCQEKGAKLRVIPVDDRGQLILSEYERLLGPRTKLVAVTQVSNALGSVTPSKALVDAAHRHGVPVLLDAAQSVSHMRVDVQALDCDFLVFSGHKVFGPTGIGAVVAKKAILDAMPPWQGGGNMIADVTFERTVFQPPPARFEAGTGNIADAVGLGAALDWLTRVGIENVAAHEHALLEYGTHKLLEIPGLRIIGTAAEKAGVLSFTIAGHDTHAISTFLDREGIAVRGGHHCAQPILRRFGLESTVRASLAPYNTFEDLDALHAALCKLQGTR